MFTSRIDSSEDTVVWSCGGALDSYSATLARAEAASLTRCKTLVVDLTGCVFVDSAGLRILEEAASMCGASRVVVRTSDHRLLELLRIAGFDRIFELDIVEPRESGSRIRRMRTARSMKSPTYRRPELSRITPTPRAQI